MRTLSGDKTAETEQAIESVNAGAEPSSSRAGGGPSGLLGSPHRGPTAYYTADQEDARATAKVMSPAIAKADHDHVRAV